MGLCQTVTGTQSVRLCLLALAVDIFPNIYQPLPRLLKSPSLRPRGKGWSGLKLNVIQRQKIMPGYAIVCTRLNLKAECPNRNTKGSETARDPRSYAVVPEELMSYSACHISYVFLSFFQGYHRSNHFIATQGEYRWRAWSVYLCVIVWVRVSAGSRT